MTLNDQALDYNRLIPLLRSIHGPFACVRMVGVLYDGCYEWAITDRSGDSGAKPSLYGFHSEAVAYAAGLGVKRFNHE